MCNYCVIIVCFVRSSCVFPDVFLLSFLLCILVLCVFLLRSSSVMIVFFQCSSYVIIVFFFCFDCVLLAFSCVRLGFFMRSSSGLLVFDLWSSCVLNCVLLVFFLGAGRPVPSALCPAVVIVARSVTQPVPIIYFFFL